MGFTVAFIMQVNTSEGATEDGGGGLLWRHPLGRALMSLMLMSLARVAAF